MLRPLKIATMLCLGRTTRLAGKYRMIVNLFEFIFDYKANHGVASTVKLLKAYTVAMQKYMGNNRLRHLRDLEPSLCMHRLSRDGLPKVIPLADRILIRQYHLPTIRFWMSLFNLYRVIEAPGELKLKTILAPFSGNVSGLKSLLRFARTVNLLDQQFITLDALQPKNFILSRSASPSNNPAFIGILTDVRILQKEDHKNGLWSAMMKWLTKIQAADFMVLLEEVTSINKMIDSLPDEGSTIAGSLIKSNFDREMIKPGIRVYGSPSNGTDNLAQFATKFEPAGKIRLFALGDSITQSVMKPLHDEMFRILKYLGKEHGVDGTFDQELAVKTAQFMATEKGNAWSFDLSAATDRLPVLLTATIIGNLLGNSEMGRLWKFIVASRPFGFSDKEGQNLGLKPSFSISNQVRNDPTTTGPFYYKVGQPMGFLTSWGGLAITHHWVVQKAALDARVIKLGEFFTDYVVLGDDIVIFNESVAKEYLVLMATLGCEINLSKSILAPTAPVFEFAKRLSLKGSIISGVSLNQLQSNWKLGGRIATVLQMLSSGLLVSKSLLSALLSRNAINGQILSNFKTKSSRNQKELAIALLALSGSLLTGTKYTVGKVSLAELLYAMLPPKWGESLDQRMIHTPIQWLLQTISSALNITAVPNNLRSYTLGPTLKIESNLSKIDSRDLIYRSGYSEMMLMSITDSLYSRVYELAMAVEDKIFAQSQSLWYGASVNDWSWASARPLTREEISFFPDEFKALYQRIANFYSYIIGVDSTWYRDFVKNLETKGVLTPLPPKHNPLSLVKAAKYILQDSPNDMEDLVGYIEKILDLEDNLLSLDMALAEISKKSKKELQADIFETAPALSLLAKGMNPRRPTFDRSVIYLGEPSDSD